MRIYVSFLVIWSVVNLGCSSKPPQVEFDLAIKNVAVITMQDEQVMEDRAVLVKDGKIVGILAQDMLHNPDSKDVIDGQDKYLMPGIAEMHAHIPVPQMGPNRVEETLFLYLSNGITTIRGMLGQPFHLDLRQQVIEGNVLGPRIYTSSPSLNGNTVTTLAEARQKVESYARDGYDFLKIHPGIKLEVFDTLVATAQTAEIAFAGHVPVDVGVRHALESGYASIDHIDGFVEGLVPASKKLDPNSNGFFGVNFAAEADAIMADDLVEMTTQHKVWVVPTQSLMESVFSPLSTEEIMARPEMKYMSPKTRQQWFDLRESFTGSTEQQADTAEFMRLRRAFIEKLYHSGHGLLLGSDAPQVFNVPGFSIQHELQSLVKAGLTPYEALRTGTVNPSVFFAAEDVFGTIEEGKIADLILLNKNPLADIRNMQDIEGVMVRGKWLNREFLDSELGKIAARYSK